MTAIAQYRNFKQLLDVSWSTIPDGLFKRVGTNVVAIGTPAIRGKGSTVHLAIRTDGLPGVGSEEDPFDASSMLKFDTLMASFPANTWIHLMGPGPFRTQVGHSWVPKSGWVIEGDGMTVTTLQLGGSAAGVRGSWCIGLDIGLGNVSDNVTIRNLHCDSNWAELQTTADTGLGGEKNIKTGAVSLRGTNNHVQNVWSSNTYGSLANSREQFAILLSADTANDSIENTITDCICDTPNGTFGTPYALFGASPKVITAKVTNCQAYGINDGLALNGFTTGGVNLADVKQVEIDSCLFVDCNGCCYHDTGAINGLRVVNNVVIRGWQCCLDASSVPDSDIEILNNYFDVQNRIAGMASYGIAGGGSTWNRVKIEGNTVIKDPVAGGGGGGSSVVGIQVDGASTTALVLYNTIHNVDTNSAAALVKIIGNRDFDGSLIAGLTDNITGSIFNGTVGFDAIYVVASNRTTTGQSLVDVTDLVTGTLKVNTSYEFEADLFAGTSNDTNGTQYGVNITVAPTTINAVYTGPTTVSGGRQSILATGTNANNTSSGTSFLTTANETGNVKITGNFTTAGTGSPVFSIQHLKTSSGTSTVFAASVLKIRAVRAFIPPSL